jgi:dienelactone hydrolase
LVPSGHLRLKGSFWKPASASPVSAVLFVHGSGGADAVHTGGLAMTAAAERLGPVFAHHNYAFLYLFRRGHGLSADQAPFLQDLLQREQTEYGVEARMRLHVALLTREHLDDVMAGVRFLKNTPRVDADRLAIVGHSFGGQLTVLAAERDSTLRAVIAFAAAAGSWAGSAAVRERLTTAVRQTTVPLMFLHAANDFSTVPGQTLAGELARLGKPHRLKIYRPCRLRQRKRDTISYTPRLLNGRLTSLGSSISTSEQDPSRIPAG